MDFRQNYQKIKKYILPLAFLEAMVYNVFTIKGEKPKIIFL